MLGARPAATGAYLVVREDRGGPGNDAGGALFEVPMPWRTMGRHLATWPVQTALIGLIIPFGYIAYSYIPHLTQYTLWGWTQHLWLQERALLLYLTVPPALTYAMFGYLGAIQVRHVLAQQSLMEEFLHMAAHDIRAPLTVIDVATQLLVTPIQGKSAPDREALFRTIARQARVMRELVTELLDLNKIEAGQLTLQRERVSMEDLIRRACGEMAFLLEQQKSVVEIVVQGADTTACVDGFRIRQVLRNLLSNAIKHVSADGRLRLTLDATARRRIQINVYNDGPPIPDEYFPHLFNKFAQATRRDVEMGVGLGLVICHRIIALHHGRIWAENVGVRGVEFCCTVPRA
ncbi:MAG: HAMP domain-containing histidine kinase [Deltaproteobacteria bacterium]|nr:HAMP domain-containing histidine kinase [Deltaproteobacteria bacterium]